MITPAGDRRPPCPPPRRRATLPRRVGALLLAPLLVLLLPPPTSAAAAAGAARDEIRFNRDIRPILSENCFHCHGPDTSGRKAGLRLDTREGFAAVTKKHGPVVTPGQPERSELWRRVTAADPDDVMPPPETHKTLTPAQRELLRRWIASGAPWQPHWSFIKPERPPLPAVKNAGWVRNPIDRFVAAKLESRGLKPAPEADRRTLARRVALDLTGLPPEPAAVEEFVQDRSAQAYETYVRRLMDSPRWGEHRARYWLDAARYADTHGMHFDNYREIFPYRDYVIAAFNRNEPFDQFTIEQLAGDLLADPSEEQLIATGFHRCSLSTNEGGTIAEENLANYARDRVETTAWVWLGLTANCAVCHDHKFDPITARNFYAMSAYFRNTTQEAFDGNVKDSKPFLVVPSVADRPRWRALPGEIAAAQAGLKARRKEAAGGYEWWAQTNGPAVAEAEMNSEALSLHLPLTDGAGLPAAARGDARATGEFSWRLDGKLGPAAPVTRTNLIEAPEAGDFDKTNAFSCAAWIRPAEGGRSGSLLARMDQGGDHRGWDVFLSGKRIAVHMVGAWDKDALKVITRDEVAPPGEWRHVLMTSDGSGKAAGVKIYVDGREQPVNVERDALEGSMRTPLAFRVGRRSGDEALDGLLIQDVRIYARAIPPAEASKLGGLSFARAVLSLPRNRRMPIQRDGLFDYYLAKYDAPHQALQARIAGLVAEQNAVRDRSPVTLIQQERGDARPTARILNRGQYDQPRDEVGPAVFTWLAPEPPDNPPNRYGLARWLVSPENPLTARVTVNRFWQEVFGAGIVRSTVDFGVMGDAPSNQELLDWLAVEFEESGWDVKRLFTLMVTSATYRQSAAATPEKLEKDPENRLLSRGPRFRMDAEMIRDAALSAGGLLSDAMGGPSVKPYQPAGVWESVAMPESNTRIYAQDHGPALYRRSLYTFWKRAAPPASLEALNAPSRETACLRRERTDTPIQALVTLNDPQFVEAARALAAQCLKAGAGRPETVLDLMARRLLSRPLKREEAAVARAGLERFLADFRAHPDEAARLTAVGEARPADEPQPVLAAWTLLANGLMNLDESLNK